MRSALSDVLDALEPSTVCDTIGEYRITSQLGEGGMGIVYAAVHPVIGKRVAIKVMRADLGANADAVERFVREAQAINRIGHPNIVDVFGFGTLADGRHYYVMALLAGQTLGDRMRAPMTLGECVVVVDQIARALEAAHEAGVVHRDLKPENVFLAEVRGEPPRATLLDFGIAKLTDDAIDRTAAGMMVGTPLYASPEQARGTRVDARSDIYTLGVMMFEMMAGTLPFVATSSHELLAQHVGEQAPRAIEHHAGIPRAIDDLLAAMLAKDPEARPSLATVRTVLAPFASDSSQPITWAPRAVVRVRARGSVAPATLPLTPSVRAAPSIHIGDAADSGIVVSRLLPVHRTPSGEAPAPVPPEHVPLRRSRVRPAAALLALLALLAWGALVATGNERAADSRPLSTNASPTSASPTSASPTSTSPTSVSPTSEPPTKPSPTSASATSASLTNAVATSASPTSASATRASPTSASPMNASPANASPASTSPSGPASQRAKPSRTSARAEAARTPKTGPPMSTAPAKAPVPVQTHDVRDPFASAVHDPFAAP